MSLVQPYYLFHCQKSDDLEGWEDMNRFTQAISHGQSFLSHTTQEYFTHDTISLFLEESNKEMPLMEPWAPREPKSRPPTIREFHAHQSLLWIYSHPRFLWSISFDSLIISHQLPTKCWIMTNIMRGPNYYVQLWCENG